jgi:Fe-S-cluster containining protein
MESLDDQPWYASGLRFRCTQCGNCCTGEPGFVWVDAEEIDALAEFVGESRERFLALYTRVAHRGHTLREKLDGACIFYEAGKGCTVYPVRPRQCQTWPFWESNLRTPERWQRTRASCPGAGTGDLVSAEEITRRLNMIRL